MHVIISLGKDDIVLSHGNKGLVKAVIGADRCYFNLLLVTGKGLMGTLLLQTGVGVFLPIRHKGNVGKC